MRLDSYYFVFDSTGSHSVDSILSEVASAGRGFHYTEDWDDKTISHPPKSHIDMIQEAANNAANREKMMIDLIMTVYNDPLKCKLCISTVKHIKEVVEKIRESNEKENK